MPQVLLTADSLSSLLLLLLTDLIVKILLETITTAVVSLLNINVSNGKGRSRTMRYSKVLILLPKFYNEV